MLTFENWITTENFRTGAKLGLYPEIDDALGQTPPLYGMARSADLITYLYIKFGKDGPPMKSDGLYDSPKQKVIDKTK